MKTYNQYATYTFGKIDKLMPFLINRFGFMWSWGV